MSLRLTPLSDTRVTNASQEEKNLLNSRLKKGHVLKCASTGKLISAPEKLSVELPTAKPNEWFLANASKKPLVRIPKTTILYPEFSKIVKFHAEKGTLTTAMALVYLRFYFAELKSSPLEKDWESYNVVIGKAGEVLTPLSLVEIEDGEEIQLSESSTSTLATGEQHALALFILAVSRMVRTTNSTHLALISEKVLDTMKGFMPSSTSASYHLMSASTTYSGWTGVPSYLKMIAALDMFMFHERHHPLSSMRIATVASRFKDCAALTSMNHLSQILSYTSCAAIGFWCFTAQLGAEYKNLFSGSEELDIQESYFPYQMDFGLTPKSAYSSVTNPTMYFFVHVVGALLGSKRSQHARMTLDSAILPTTNLAIWIALIHANSESFIRTFVEIDEPIRNPNDELDEEEAALVVGRPQELSPALWFHYLLDHKFKFTVVDVKKFDLLKSNMGSDIRENTIGSYLSNHRIVADR